MLSSFTDKCLIQMRGLPEDTRGRAVSQMRTWVLERAIHWVRMGSVLHPGPLMINHRICHIQGPDDGFYY